MLNKSLLAAVLVIMVSSATSNITNLAIQLDFGQSLPNPPSVTFLATNYQNFINLNQISGYFITTIVPVFDPSANNCTSAGCWANAFVYEVFYGSLCSSWTPTQQWNWLSCYANGLASLSMFTNVTVNATATTCAQSANPSFTFTPVENAVSNDYISNINITNPVFVTNMTNITAIPSNTGAPFIAQATQQTASNGTTYYTFSSWNTGFYNFMGNTAQAACSFLSALIAPIPQQCHLTPGYMTS